MKLTFLTVLALASQPAPPAAAPPAPGDPAQPPAAAPPATTAGVIPVGTPLRLMVWNEVSTRSAKAGDRFLLVLDSDVRATGAVAIPRGTKAWGEVVSARTSGMVGRAGTLETRLLHIEIGGRPVPIAPASTTAVTDKGRAGTLQVVLATAALTPWGPFARGNNARLKAGHIIEAVLAVDVPADDRTPQ